MANITPKQYEFLKILAKIGYITNPLIEQAGLVKKQTSNHFITRQLLGGGYIGRIMVVPSFGFGRKVLYYLTKKGAGLVAEVEGVELDDLIYSNLKGGIQTSKDGQDTSVVRADFVHKERYISLFLALEKYLEKTNYYIAKPLHYYQPKKHGTALTLNGKNFRPDGIVFCESVEPNKPVFAYVMEIHRHSDRRKIINQLRQQAQAIEQKSFKNRFGVEYPHFVLSVFTDENLKVMQSVVQELQNFPEWGYIKAFFMFARLEDLKQDFYNGFAYFGGEKKPLPPLVTS